MKEYVVIPTYKEYDNLRIILPKLSAFNIIIVDDNSRDGTEALCRKFSNVRLMTRPFKMGLASAVMAGVASIKEKDAGVVVTDADFEHDHSRIGDIFKALKTKDFVECVKVGKRDAKRSLISMTGKLICRSAVPESNVLKDPMSGFFGFRPSKVNLNGVHPLGYKIMLEIFMNLKPKSRIGHLYYRYGERKKGKSKLSVKVVLEFVLQVLELSDFRFAWFLGIGIFNTLLNEVCLYILYQFMPLTVSLALSILIPVIPSFLLNHYITFKARSMFLPSLWKFTWINMLTFAINYTLALYLSTSVFYLVANFIAIIVAFVVRYAIAENYIWKTERKIYEDTA